MKNTKNRPRVPLTAFACFTTIALTIPMGCATSDPSKSATDDGAVTGTARSLGTPTFVSLTFDDSRSSQRNAGAILAANNTRGTFYINSAMLGTSGYYMALSDIRALAAAGNEIGGHTLNHVDLTSTSTSNAIQQVCQDQANIQAWGFAGVSFAYPYGSVNSGAEAIVRNCKSQGYAVTNYLSARSIDGLQCSGCPAANNVPPDDPYDLGTPGGSPTNTTTLAQFEAMVTNAEATGGWLVIPFHSVCNAPSTAPAPGNVGDCKDQYTVDYATLNSFVSWLKARESLGTTIRTVQEMMTGVSLPPPTVDAGAPLDSGTAVDSGTVIDSGTTPDASTIDAGSADAGGGPSDAGSADAGASDAGQPPPIPGNLVPNASFEIDANGDGRPDCWKLDGYGSNTYSYTRVSGNAHSGTYSERVTITRLSSGDRKVVTAQDTTSCTMLATVGGTYTVSGWFTSNRPVRIAVYYHDSGGWHWWAESPYAPASSQWSQIVWTTPPIPSFADRWSYGLALTSVGTMTVDDFSATAN